MKYMFASDVHGSAFYCRKMLEAYREEGAERLVLLGDLLYHGPRNDLPKEYAPKEVIKMLNGMKQGRWRRLLFCGTGALLSPTSTLQGESIPSICHAVAISTEQ